MTFARPINTQGQQPRITGPYSSGHRGIDYGYNAGTPVYAAQAGKVTIAKGDEIRQWIANSASDPFRQTSGTRQLRTEDYGNFIKIDHGNGYSTLYTHLKHGSLKVKVGDTVKQGQQIGEVGSTGNSTGNHLHWETRRNDVTFDPFTMFEPNFTDYAAGGGDSSMTKAEMQKEMDQLRKDRDRNWNFYTGLITKIEELLGLSADGDEAKRVKTLTNKLGELIAERDTYRETAEKLREKNEKLVSRLEEGSKAAPEVRPQPTQPIIPPQAAELDYPYWKELGWRFLRTGVAAGVATVAFILPATQFDPADPIPYGLALGSAFVSGFIAAASKAIRDHFGHGDKSARIEKLPV